MLDSEMVTCAVNIQGVLGEGTLVFSFGVLLVMVTRMDVLICFRALLDIVGRSKSVGPHLGGGWFHVLIWTQVSTALGDYVTLRLIRGCALGPLEASALGGKTFSPYGKVRVIRYNHEMDTTSIILH